MSRSSARRPAAILLVLLPLLTTRPRVVAGQERSEAGGGPGRASRPQVPQRLLLAAAPAAAASQSPPLGPPALAANGAAGIRSVWRCGGRRQPPHPASILRFTSKYGESPKMQIAPLPNRKILIAPAANNRQHRHRGISLLRPWHDATRRLARRAPGRPLRTVQGGLARRLIVSPISNRPLARQSLARQSWYPPPQSGHN